MGTYKVLQDIEAEDKILGPLTLKQFIFAIITIALGFLAFFLGSTNILLAVPWILPIAFFGFMAAPIGRDQPNDVWLAARIRFLIKPRKRIWDQAGMQELVTITVPKKIEISRTDGLSQTEVKGRLSALSSLMDSRGWAIKGIDTATYASSGQAYGMRNVSSNRLIDLSDFQETALITGITDSDDIMDAVNNTTAQRIDTAIKEERVKHIDTLKEQIKTNVLGSEKNSAPANVDYSFINQEAHDVNPGYVMFGDKVVNPGSKAEPDTTIKPINTVTSKEEDVLLQKLHHQQEINQKIKNSTREHRIEPHKPVQNIPQSTTNRTAPNAIIRQLGQSNDLSVDALAKLARHAEKEASLNEDEVISLH